MPRRPFHRFSPLLGMLALVATVLVSGQAQAQTATSPQAVAERLQQRYRTVQTLTADFVQTTGGQQMRGTLQVRGDAFRLDLPDQTLVTDGRTMWSFSRADNQVIIQAYDPSQVGFSIGQLFTDYLAVFRVTGASTATIGGVRHDVLALRPRQTGTAVRDATLFVRSSDAIPTRVRVHDTSGGTLAFDLSNVRLNAPLGADTFRFTPPRGADVVDLRG